MELEIGDLGLEFEVPQLGDDELHLWVARLKRPLSQQQYLGTFLNQDEQERAARFHFDRDRHWYVAARGILRTLLGAYLEMPPQDVPFVYGEHGKPSLNIESSLCFNVSHSHGVGLFGFVRNREIGVDVEQVRTLSDGDQIARRFFSATEVAAYHSVPVTKRPMAFFNCWTRKEAFIKAIGEGLSCPLASFDVTLLPGEPARLTAVRNQHTTPDQWQLASFSPFPDFIGAVIANTPAWELRLFHLPD